MLRIPATAMSSAPILRVGKLKAQGRSTLASADGHLSRTRPTHNADASRTGDNVWLAGGPGQLAERVFGKMRQKGIDPDRLRADATLANDIVLSISPEWFRPDHPDRPGTWDPERLASFRREAVAFLREQFPGLVATAVLHLDEATPHVQAVVVPALPRGEGKEGHRLSGRDMFNPTRLEALQEAWERRVRPLGVGPRLRGSTSRHVPLATFYAASRNPPPVPSIVPAPPPAGAMVPVLGREALKDWQKGEAKKARKRLRPLEAKAAAAALYEAERRGADALRGQLKEERGSTRDLRAEVDRLGHELDLSKDQVARLRGLPLNQVATALSHTGPVGPRENAIDLLKRVGGLDYREAVAWLYHAFGTDAAAGAAADATRRELQESPPPPVLSKPDRVKARAIARQLDALAAPAYRLTIMREVDGDQVGQNLGKREGQAERTWTRDEVLGMVPMLSARNAQGGNVFVTPLDPAARHVLVDDLDEAGVASLKGRGYQVATLAETSPANHQAVVKVGTDLPEGACNEWFKALNRELGDARITGLSHPFRLAGFQNRKDKHQQPNGHYPFVRLIEATNRFCARARQVVQDMAQTMHQGPRLPRP